MTKPEWGTKRECQSCGKRFYDLNRTPITCPQCGTVLELKKASAKLAKTEPVKAAAKAVAPIAVAAGVDAAGVWSDDEALEEESRDDDLADIDETLDDDEDDSEDEKALLVDSSDLDEDEVAEVKEHLNSPADE